MNAWSASFSQSAVPHPWFPPWTPSGWAAGQQRQWLPSRGARWQVVSFSWQCPIMVINLTMVWGHSWPFCPSVLFRWCKSNWGSKVIVVDAKVRVITVGAKLNCSYFWTSITFAPTAITLHSPNRNAYSQVWWRFHWQATQCAVTGLGHKTISRILWITCLY